MLVEIVSRAALPFFCQSAAKSLMNFSPSLFRLPGFLPPRPFEPFKNWPLVPRAMVNSVAIAIAPAMHHHQAASIASNACRPL